ncbi:tetratricopeptide repeat protein [Methylosinus sporium]|uniref:Tetratricopeptide repeat protein n=1 Tax=Methylosinus sporium TaxID=428 RepID=A0A549T2J9_METSR|nr:MULTISPECIES: tetratricopeptide repeat protein [Methylosinus]MBU3890058.1 tetratricopeptide repeat protein [Methylosinus sp. KRF6]TRL36099.1 tetratricopeptide repeat protein [Methylosinus sporium]
MSDIFHEVDEDIRRDKAANLWKRYQTPVIVGAFLVVVATGAYSFYESNRIKAAEGANVRFSAAAALATQGKGAEAVAAFEALAKDSPRGYATLARLRAAQELAHSDKAKAVAAFDAISEDKGVDKLTQQVAKLRAGLILLEQGERQKMADRLGELVTANGPFRFTAQELLGLDALQDSDFNEAERVFKLILNDQEAPHAMRQRAGAYKALLEAARGAAPPPAAAPAAGQDAAPAPAAPAGK